MPEMIKDALERYARLADRRNPSYRAMAEEGLCHTNAMNVAIAKGHRYPSGGREMYDGRITYPTDDLPEMLEVDGVLYGRIVEVDDIRTLGQGDTWLVSKVTPEDGMRRETRGASV